VPTINNHADGVVQRRAARAALGRRGHNRGVGRRRDGPRGRAGQDNSAWRRGEKREKPTSVHDFPPSAGHEAIVLQAVPPIRLEASFHLVASADLVVTIPPPTSAVVDVSLDVDPNTGLDRRKEPKFRQNFRDLPGFVWQEDRLPSHFRTAEWPVRRRSEWLTHRCHLPARRPSPWPGRLSGTGCRCGHPAPSRWQSRWCG
jgi:hypothetical protein